MSATGSDSAHPIIGNRVPPDARLMYTTLTDA